MARQRISGTTQRTASGPSRILSFRVPEAEYLRLEAEARAAGQSVGDYARTLTLGGTPETAAAAYLAANTLPQIESALATARSFLEATTTPAEGKKGA